MSPSKALFFAVIIGLLALLAPQVLPGMMSGLVAGHGAGATEGATPPEPTPAAVDPQPSDGAPPDDPARMALSADADGHFAVNAMIDGRAVDALVDTGATLVVINGQTARRLGITPDRSEFTARISTANGVIAAAPVTLAEVRVAGIVVRDVAAVVIDGDGLPFDLLGMSFLSRLSTFAMSGGRLVLVR